MTYFEPVLKVGSVEEVLDVLMEADHPPLVVLLGDRYYPLHQLLLALDGRLSEAVRVLSSNPGLRVALKLLAQGRYLVVRGKAVTPRSVLFHLLEEGALDAEVLAEKLSRYPVPCLRCNVAVKTVVRVFEAKGAVAVPLCWKASVRRVVTVVDALSYALSSGLSRRDLLLDRSPASRLGASAPRFSHEPVQALLTGLYAVTPEGSLLDVSSARMALGELSVEV